MTHSISLAPTPARADQAAVDAIARETATSVDVVKALYEKELATLAAHATVRQYVGVIATSRVRQHLRRGREGPED